ncbi:MAG: hypothetical protein R3F59_33235 [Myxococcota bacterium]
MRTMFPLVAAVLVACAPKVEESALEGPGVDEAGRIAVDAEELLVGLTHLQVRNAPKPGKRFGELASSVGGGLFEDEPEGWVGAAFRSEGKLEQWTMTVWESEEALMAFVVSERHAAAMAEFGDVAVGGETRSLWLPTGELPLTWERAMQLLEEEPDVVLGDSRWYED